MSDRFLLYHQKVGGEDVWNLALAEARQQLVTETRPRFVTVLDVNGAVEEGWSREQIDGLKYRGPLYFDFDGEDIAEVMAKARVLFGKIVELDVDPRALRLFATGGRGFHIEVPWEIFIPKPPKGGVQRLPAIYKEMAYDLYVDTMDLRVYSGRKGRMWRTPNVQRENGRFKVPITPEELMEMSVEDYQAVCAAPRQAPTLTPPVLSQKLAVAFAKAEDKVAAASKKRKDSKTDLALLAKFKGGFPPTLLRVMAGELAGTQGFHKIALQVAITSNALGKTEDQTIELCAGVIEKHVSDSQRYNTPVKRKNEILRMLRYTQGNPCYEYSRDAVRSLVPVGTATADLDGLSAEASGAVTAEGDSGNDEGLLGGVFVTEKGVFSRTEDGAKKISEISFKDVKLLCSAETGEPFGYEAEVLLNGKSKGRRLIDTSVFLSKQKYQQFCMSLMGIFQGNDNQAAAITSILRDTAMKNNNIIYIVHREGLDLIQRPGETKKLLDFLWVSPTGVDTNQSPITYKHRGSPNPEGYFKSDLTDAPDLEANEDTAAVIDALLRFNEPYTVANLIGWFTSAFHRQIYHHLPDSQFPLLQVYGQAGAGKTQTMQMLLKMFYYLSSPITLMADSSTPHGIRTSIQSSASIPVVLEEFKPRQMDLSKVSAMRQMFRAAYNAQTVAKGGMAEGINSSWRDVRLFAFSAPICFIGESLETETAILERTISIPLSKPALTGKEKFLYILKDRAEVLSSLGKEIVRATFALDISEFKKMLAANQQVANQIAFKRNNQRVVFNMAVAMNGLQFLEQVIQHHFADRFTERFASLRGAMLDISKHVAVSVMPEAAKALNVLAHISKTETSDSEFFLKDGVDYTLADETMDLQMRNCYFKYVAWAKRKSQVPLYDNEEAFIHGLGNFSACTNRACADNKDLKPTGMEKVYRFNLDLLHEEGVEGFREGA